MSLKLYCHPLSSFCQKVLMALYENETAFEPHIVDLGNAQARAEFRKVWPIGKFPVLRDDARNRTVPESSIIIEYLSQHYPGRVQLLPRDADLAREARFRDRFFDLYVNVPMQKIVTDLLRPAGRSDPQGVEDAKAVLATALGMIDQDMASKAWATGSTFGLADCAAAPALVYANVVVPFEKTHPHAAAYLHRLLARPSFARALKETQPFVPMFPLAETYAALYRDVLKS